MNKQYNLHITVGDWSPANIPIYNIEQNIRSDAKYKIRCKIKDVLLQTGSGVLQTFRLVSQKIIRQSSEKKKMMMMITMNIVITNQ